MNNALILQKEHCEFSLRNKERRVYLAREWSRSLPFYSTAMKVLGQHRCQGATLHLVRGLANCRHLRRLVPQAFNQPNQIAVADECVAVETQPRHRADVDERVRRQPVKLVVVQKQTLQRRQIVERTRSDLPQVVVMQVQLLESWEPCERARRDVLHAIFVQVEYPQIRCALERAHRQSSNMIVVQQQGMQFLESVKRPRTHLRDAVKSEISERISNFGMNAGQKESRRSVVLEKSRTSRVSCRKLMMNVTQ